MAPEVSTSSGKGDFPAEAQCTQLLSQAKVHRQGKMYKGPFLIMLIHSINPRKNGYLTLRKKASKKLASTDLSDSKISNTSSSP
jgi:hypothetical protein